MQRRRYTDKERARAVGIATAIGTTEAARETGAPIRSIQYWMNQPKFAHLRAKTSQEVADAYWAALQLGVERMVELMPKTDDLKAVAVAVGILHDKHALLTGEATARTETLTGTLPDADLIASLDYSGPRRIDEETPTEAAG